jgi:hypothetical protein
MGRRALVAALLCAAVAIPIVAAPVGVDALVGSVTAHAAEQLIGVTPALANTPFLGLATLCGLALVADTAWARESPSAVAHAIRRNELITRMRPYSSGWIFALLLGIALLVYAANSGKLQGLIGKLAHLVEAVVVLVAYVVLSTTVLRDLPKPPPQPVAQMGVFPVTTAILLGAAAVVALAAMMIVRFAIGLAIWLIPIPLVDFAFESLKKVATLLFIALYLVSPLLSTIVAVALILLSLLVVRWAWRLMSFVAGVVVLPRVGFCRPVVAAETLTVHACVLTARGFRRRQSATLAIVGNEIRLLRRSPDRTPAAVFRAPRSRLVLVRGFWWSELRDLDAKGAVVGRIAFPTAAFDALQRAATPLGVTIDQSKLSLWLTPARGARIADAALPDGRSAS